MESELRSNIRTWLKAKHTTLWMNWDLTDEEELEGAITFVEETYRDIEELMHGI